jgi:hypothetical protein
MRGKIEIDIEQFGDEFIKAYSSSLIDIGWPYTHRVAVGQAKCVMRQTIERLVDCENIEELAEFGQKFVSEYSHSLMNITWPYTHRVAVGQARFIMGKIVNSAQESDEPTVNLEGIEGETL